MNMSLPAQINAAKMTEEERNALLESLLLGEPELTLAPPCARGRARSTACATGPAFGTAGRAAEFCRADEQAGARRLLTPQETQR